jgi:uncharacterized membrane protein
VEKANEKRLKSSGRRLIWLDLFRGTAIGLMILFHFCYDLNYFGYLRIDIGHDPFWLVFRWIIVWIFLLAVGISLVLVHGGGIRWRSVFRRIGILGGAAALVSLATWVVFPRSWVYFGILHFILTASLAALPFVGRPRLALGTALLILGGSAAGILHMHGLYEWLRPFLHLPRYTKDLVPFVPWFGVVLLGVAFASAGWHRTPLLVSVEARGRATRTLAFLGRHALAVYLLHLPLLFGAVMLGSRLFGP